MTSPTPFILPGKDAEVERPKSPAYSRRLRRTHPNDRGARPPSFAVGLAVPRRLLARAWAAIVACVAVDRRPRVHRTGNRRHPVRRVAAERPAGVALRLATSD